MKANFLAFIAIFALTSATGFANADDFVSREEHNALLERLAALESRLRQDDCPCDLAQISNTIKRFFEKMNDCDY